MIIKIRMDKLSICEWQPGVDMFFFVKISSSLHCHFSII